MTSSQGTRSPYTFAKWPIVRRCVRARRPWSVVAATALTVSALGAVAPTAHAEGAGQCQFGSRPTKGTPWSLQRVMLSDLWRETKGEGARVAVIDTGVDPRNPQLRKAVDTKNGANYLPAKLSKDKYGQRPPRGRKNGTSDRVGHGTKVAGIIAARKMDGTGFVGLAPRATVIPIIQNDENGNGDTDSLARAIRYAVSQRVDVINISQDTERPLESDSALEQAVNHAVSRGTVVVASAGNDGLGGQVKKTYPAAYENVLAVGASDRNNERAPFSQAGDFVDVAAPGVDMVSTVPISGHCPDNGTSFAAPYVAGVAALLAAKHPKWRPHHISAQIMQTAERSVDRRDRNVGWGVVDPVRALTEDSHPIDNPVAHEGLAQGKPPDRIELAEGETAQERNERLGTYALISGGVLVAVIAGGALVVRDWRRRSSRTTTAEA
ncbi:type VII secretion-associated serine protease mycosin [Streptomyces sp. NPDC005438]|uniref:type VII secretion-associated serine protease mycosin n=1 Tax=Streptomyces sp. NPDC005438 TaxID=3156880 RepID=UPI0033A25A56